jgi:hypothetical protein
VACARFGVEATAMIEFPQSGAYSGPGTPPTPVAAGLPTRSRAASATRSAQPNAVA